MSVKVLPRVICKILQPCLSSRNLWRKSQINPNLWSSWCDQSRIFNAQWSRSWNWV